MRVSFQKLLGIAYLEGTANEYLNLVSGLAMKFLWFSLIMRQRVIETFSSVPSLSRRWRDHFYDLSTSRHRAGLRIPLDKLGAAVSPTDKS